MVGGAPSRSICRCLSYLEVRKLLQHGSEVVYLEGLNVGFKQLVWDEESTNELAMLLVNLPRTTHGDVTMTTSPWSSMPISSLHSVTECPSDTVTRPSMETEVEEHLSGILPNTAEPSGILVSPRKPPPVAPNTLVASKEEVPPDLGEIIPVFLKQSPPFPQESSQVGMVNVTAHSSCSPSPTPGTLERNSTAHHLEQQANSITLPDDVLHLQEEMNNAMVHLLSFRALVDIHWQRLIS